MHCRTTTAPGFACYVSNFGAFDASPEAALTALQSQTSAPFATVAMAFTPPVTSPNAVTFFVYNATGALQTSAKLDTVGDDTAVPHVCINCHGSGASYDTTRHAAIGARVLAFDPASFAYGTAPGLTLADEQPTFAALNQIVRAATPDDATARLVDGLFPSGSYDPSYVPAGWSATDSNRADYTNVVAPYCRNCHVTHGPGTTDPLTFETASDFKASKDAILRRVCGAGPLGMPPAMATTDRLFASGASVLLLTYLNAPGACAMP